MDIRNNLLINIREKYVVELSSFYDKGEARQFVNILIEHFFGLRRTELALNRNYRLSESEILKLHFAVKDLKNYRPIQYVTGETEFLGYIFQVNESVLIPRPETEELVQLIISAENYQNLRILDIGTGSGCIAITLEKALANSIVEAVDIDENALKLASANASKNNSKVFFYQSDILDEAHWDRLGTFDIIVSNPPYVTENEKSMMAENVLKYEPHKALFVPVEDELIFYDKICMFAMDHLLNEGRIYFEINETKGNKIVNLLQLNGFHTIKLHQDFRGKTRFASAVKAKN